MLFKNSNKLIQLNRVVKLFTQSFVIERVGHWFIKETKHLMFRADEPKTFLSSTKVSYRHD